MTQPKLPHKSRPKNEPSPVATLLRDALKLPMISNEAVSANGRTIKAALKTTDHTELAKLHAAAIRNFGDDALNEVADFHDQLLEKDAETYRQWWKAFETEAPDLADRLKIPLEEDEKPESKPEPEPEPEPEAPEEPEEPETDCDEIKAERVEAEEYLADIEERRHEINSRMSGIVQEITSLNHEYQDIQTSLANTHIHGLGSRLFPWTRRMRKVVGPNTDDLKKVREKLNERLDQINQDIKELREELKGLGEDKKSVETEIKEAQDIVKDIEQALEECRAKNKK